jgi:phosphoribosylglycinamide formyltransferase 1
VRQRAAVLISGRGSNMAALVAASRDPAYPVEFVLVLSNRGQAPGIALAASLGVPSAVVSQRLFGNDRAAHEAAIDAALVAADVEISASPGICGC